MQNAANARSALLATFAQVVIKKNVVQENGQPKGHPVHPVVSQLTQVAMGQMLILPAQPSARQGHGLRLGLQHARPLKRVAGAVKERQNPVQMNVPRVHIQKAEQLHVMPAQPGHTVTQQS